MSLSKFFYQLPKYYLKSPVLNNTHIIRANKIIKNKRMLQYTGSIFHTFPLMYNMLNHRCTMTHIWKFFHMMLVFTSFGNHRFQSSNWLLLDRVAIIGNSYITLVLFYKNYRRINHFNKLCFLWFFFGSIFAYLFGMLTNTLCFDTRFGYVLHALCHAGTAMACYIVLANNV
jgi:hypothetical protein